ncbi:MAG: AbrB/MazE/SpoVT family DNA-binding domain-containing protein [Rhizobiaceae bacterium]|nr:AbrB/MazE/SpoVT family DNA-binding domain-containing protein [Rhizobiaceae bacterium]
MSTTVTSKGQVTIPKDVRERLGIRPGSKVDFKFEANGEIVLKRADGQLKPAPNRFAKYVGFAGPGLTTDELMAMLRGED